MNQRLFDYFAQNHGLTLLESELADIVREVSAEQCLTITRLLNENAGLRGEMKGKGTKGTERTKGWVRVDEEMPDTDTTVLIGNEAWNDPVDLGYWDSENDVWRVAAGLRLDDAPTHWMELPEGPEVAR